MWWCCCYASNLLGAGETSPTSKAEGTAGSKQKASSQAVGPTSSVNIADWRKRIHAARRRTYMTVLAAVRFRSCLAAKAKKTGLRRIESFSYMIPNLLGADCAKFIEIQLRCITNREEANAAASAAAAKEGPNNSTKSAAYAHLTGGPAGSTGEVTDADGTAEGGADDVASLGAAAGEGKLLQEGSSSSPSAAGQATAGARSRRHGKAPRLKVAPAVGGGEGEGRSLWPMLGPEQSPSFVLSRRRSASLDMRLGDSYGCCGSIENRPRFHIPFHPSPLIELDPFRSGSQTETPSPSGKRFARKSMPGTTPSKSSDSGPSTPSRSSLTPLQHSAAASPALLSSVRYASDSGVSAPTNAAVIRVPAVGGLLPCLPPSDMTAASASADSTNIPSCTLVGGGFSRPPHRTTFGPRPPPSDSLFRRLAFSMHSSSPNRGLYGSYSESGAVPALQHLDMTAMDPKARDQKGPLVKLSTPLSIQQMSSSSGSSKCRLARLSQGGNCDSGGSWTGGVNPPSDSEVTQAPLCPQDGGVEPPPHQLSVEGSSPALTGDRRSYGGSRAFRGLQIDVSVSASGDDVEQRGDLRVEASAPALFYGSMVGHGQGEVAEMMEDGEEAIEAKGPSCEDHTWSGSPALSMRRVVGGSRYQQTLHGSFRKAPIPRGSSSDTTDTVPVKDQDQLQHGELLPGSDAEPCAVPLLAVEKEKEDAALDLLAGSGEAVPDGSAMLAMYANRVNASWAAKQKGWGAPRVCTTEEQVGSTQGVYNGGTGGEHPG
ncbi:hypothetical protein CEUSTIGMA_g13223.t1 [Chlamydomonas eustigma]|uniref:Uncharacterized protein n=1 Tax=Chlamydomonas eustigma TaxID=1157962 RepID=A0A250XRX2_9CHLO|nr:hypothetical protein CEUSTIGMA_g13223.t1 [Chlamydomonas eustigma]|eukprot:GAX85808.1 hypothetical protein CEUSTIGMA_g13223.t1 [Chlamydomonas eustigma]